MFDPTPRPPAPELSPEQLLRAVEFEFLPGAFEEAEAEA